MAQPGSYRARTPAIRYCSFALLALFLLSLTSSARAQLPFYTDDAETSEKGKVHLEFYNEHDLLQKSAYPGERQNTSVFTINYGLTKRLELGVNAPLIKIFNDRASGHGSPLGVGDTQFGIKYRLRDEREESSLPALTAVFYVEAPTGNRERQLGSGLTDYYLYGVAQKSLTHRTKMRANGGVIFAGNGSTGLVGIQTTKGQIFTAAGSLTRDFSERLRLGAELFGGVTNNRDLGRGQMTFQLGGNYALSEQFSLAFGVLAGRFPGSPRAGALLGFSYDFK